MLPQPSSLACRTSNVSLIGGVRGKNALSCRDTQCTVHLPWLTDMLVVQYMIGMNGLIQD